VLCLKRVSSSDLQGRFLASQLYTLIKTTRLNGRDMAPSEGLVSGWQRRSNFRLISDLTLLATHRIR
jgi:hypothetical protein